MSEFAAAPARVPKASDVVAAQLRGKILGEAMPVGAELPSEAELIESYGFSRSTVREALRLLESEGLIVTKRGPGGGIRVSRPDINQISRSMAILFTSQAVPHREFLMFRRLIEPPLAGLAAQAATDEQRDWLLAQARHEHSDYSGIGASVEFHQAIGICTNNRVARAVMAAMQSALVGNVPAELLSSDDIHGTTRVHVRIAELIHERKAEEAEEAMRRHLTAFIETVDAQGRLDDLALPRSYWQPK